jgi:hypothetical protein
VLAGILVASWSWQRNWIGLSSHEGTVGSGIPVLSMAVYGSMTYSDWFGVLKTNGTVMHGA